MGFVNLTPNLQQMFQSIYDRLLKLETATRFTAPNVDFSTNTPSAPRRGDQFFDTNAQMMKYWNGSQWVELADNLYGTSIIEVVATLQSANNNMVYTGTPAITKVQRIGYMITAQTTVTCTNITNFGTGQIQITMPSTFPPAVYSSTASGSIQQGGNFYTILASIDAGSRTFKLWHPSSNGGVDIVSYNKPVVLTSSAVINITGVALLA